MRETVSKFLIVFRPVFLTLSLPLLTPVPLLLFSLYLTFSLPNIPSLFSNSFSFKFFTLFLFQNLSFCPSLSIIFEHSFYFLSFFIHYVVLSSRYPSLRFIPFCQSLSFLFSSKERKKFQQLAFYSQSSETRILRLKEALK